jgi:hypothetical protein
MTQEELKECYDIFNSSWKIIKKYSERKKDDVFWDDIVKETSELIQKHDSSQFAKDVVFAVLNVMSQQN